MSRTIRRKNFIAEKGQSSWTHGSKVNGYYTYDEYLGNGLSRYRPCDKQERYEKYKTAHLDAGTINHNSLTAWARRFEMKRDRQRVGQEIIRFLKGIVEDVVVSNQAKFPYWYW